VCTGVRRIWVTLFVGLAVLSGVTTYLLVAQPIDANWIEAAGTWAVGLVGVLALVVLALWSNESDRRRERQRLQLEANNVFCDVLLGGTYPPGESQMFDVEQLEVQVINYSRRVISGIDYGVPLPGFDSWLPLREALGPHESASQRHRVLSPFKEHKDNPHLRNAEFRFSLDGVAWSKQFGQPAHRRRESDAVP
jgi:hypothetical protein